MGTAWSSVDILKPQSAASAEIVLLAGPPFGCRGSGPLCERVLQMVERIGLTSETGRAFDLVMPDGSSRVLVLGIGAATCQGEGHWLSLGGSLIEAMSRHRLAALRMPESAALGGSKVLEAILLGASLHSFHLEKATGMGKERFSPKRLFIAEADVGCADEARRVAGAVNRARAWVEQPANLLTPPVWANEVREVFAHRDARVRVLGPAELEAMGAGALFAVGRGSEHGARLLVVEWRGDASRDRWDAVMVGKGLTFDGGGLNLKPRPNISKMKLDMAGGAAVLGALELAIERKSRANVVALVPMVENAIDALGFRPGDVITSLSGITIEVADTDFEGRLVLADAMTYGLRHYEPTWIVDAATLTTAVTGVLHEEFAALYASDDELALRLVEAGETVGERLWRMPLDQSQDYLIESDVADVCNVGTPGFFGRGDGSPTAGAKFLEKFARDARWAHIDLCGTVWSTRRTHRCGKGATGYGVRLLNQWLAAIEPGEAQ